MKQIVGRQWAWAMLMAVLSMPVMASEFGMGFLKGFDGTLHTLDEYTGQGKWTVVMLWASDCSACNAEARHYVQFHRAHKDKDATMLGVSMDGRDKQGEAEAFIKRHDVDFPNLIDEPENVARLYSGLTGQGWVGTPSFLVFSPAGELRAAQVGAVPVKIIEDFITRESAADAAQTTGG